MLPNDTKPCQALQSVNIHYKETPARSLACCSQDMQTNAAAREMKMCAKENRVKAQVPCSSHIEYQSANKSIIGKRS
jgi:hypothetical protein